MNTSLINSNRGKKRTRANHFKDEETNKGTHKELEKALVPFLDVKYNFSYAAKDMYLIKKYHDFTMVDGQSIIDQISDLQMIVRELEENKMPLVEKYQIAALVAKLPLSWYDFAISLINAQERMSMNDLIIAIEIEENARAENLKLTPEKLNSINKGACWSCRKIGYVTDNCMRRKIMMQKNNACQMNSVKCNYDKPNYNQLHLLDLTSSFEENQTSSLEISLISVPKTSFRPQKRVRRILTKNSKKIKKNKERVIGACWACRKIGYITDSCTRRKNIMQKTRTICSPRTKCNHLHFLE